MENGQQNSPLTSMKDLGVDAGGRRLITHNLLHEASSFETSGCVSWFSIRELSVFIDLFCLHDQIAVLDWHLRSFPRDGNSDFFSLIEEEKFIRNYEVTDNQRILDLACTRVAIVLAENINGDQCRRLVDLCTDPDFVSQVASFFPRNKKELQGGWDWLRSIDPNVDLKTTLMRDADILRSTVFLVRTVIYICLAEVWHMPFTPDLARSNAVIPAIRAERGLRGRIIETLRTSFRGQPVEDDFDLTRNVTPLAAIVFNRASTKARIVREMVKLRRELAPLRTRLRAAEQELQDATTAMQELAAKRKWDSVFKELADEVGDEPDSVTLHWLLRIAAAVSRLAVDPTSPSKWVDTLFGLPKERLLETIRRKPLIEIYRLRRHIPATGQLRRDVDRLFEIS